MSNSPSDKKTNMHVRRAGRREATLSVWYKFQNGQMPGVTMRPPRESETGSALARRRTAAEERTLHAEISWYDRSMVTRDGSK